MHLEHYEPETSSWKGSLILFVAGTALGAAAALMMAPASGRESREYLRKQSRKVASDVSTQADRLTSAVKRSRDQATTAVRETMDTAVAQAKAAYNAAKSSNPTGDIPATMSTANTPRPAPSPRAVSSTS